MGGSSRGSSPATSAASAGGAPAPTGHTATAAAAAAMLDNVTVNMRQQQAIGQANGHPHGHPHGHTNTMLSGVVPEWSTQGQTPYVPAPPRGYLDSHSSVRPAPGPVRSSHGQGVEPGAGPGYAQKPAYGKAAKAAKALGGVKQIKPPQPAGPAGGATTQSPYPHSQAAAQHAAAAAQHAAYAAQAHAAAVAAVNGHSGQPNGHNSVMSLGMVDRSTRGNGRGNGREQGRNGKPVRSKEPTNIPARVAKAALLRQQQNLAQQGGAGRSGAGRRVQQAPYV